MAEDVAAGSPARPVVAGTSRTERARASAYYFRFTLAYALLTMLAVGGQVLAALAVKLTSATANEVPELAAAPRRRWNG